MQRRNALLQIVLFFFFLAGAAPGSAADPFPCTLPGTEIGAGLPADYEPSGAVWHTRLNRLFVVSDSGRVSGMNADGSGIMNWAVSGDLEGITVADPQTDFLYIGVEEPDSIREFDMSSGLVTRTFDLTTWMTNPANLGLEALGFVPDANDPEGGLFYAGLQNDGKIYVFRLPIVSSTTSTAVTFIQILTPAPGVTDIAGLEYDPGTGTVYALFDTANLLVQMTPAGTVLAQYDVPGNDQEGIAVRPAELFVAEDVGKEVWRYGGCASGIPPTSTPSATATATQTATVTQTATRTGTATPTLTRTRTPSATASATLTSTATRTSTASPTSTWTKTSTVTPSFTQTRTASATASPTSTSTAAATSTASATASPSSTSTAPSTATASATSTRTMTSTATPSFTQTRTASAAASATPSPPAPATSTASATASATSTPTATSTPSPVETSVQQPVPAPHLGAPGWLAALCAARLGLLLLRPARVRNQASGKTRDE